MICFTSLVSLVSFFPPLQPEMKNKLCIKPGQTRSGVNESQRIRISGQCAHVFKRGQFLTEISTFKRPGLNKFAVGE